MTLVEYPPFRVVTMWPEAGSGTFAAKTDSGFDQARWAKWVPRMLLCRRPVPGDRFSQDYYASGRSQRSVQPWGSPASARFSASGRGHALEELR